MHSDDPCTLTRGRVPPQPAVRMPKGQSTLPSSSKRRRGEASAESGMHRLAGLIREGKRTVVITGAGLSCASGIPPFRSNRSSADAVITLIAY